MKPEAGQIDNAEASAAGRGARRLALGLAATALLLVAMLAALPFLASRPRPAPDVVMTTIGGEVRHLAQLGGKPVLVSFWSTTCAPCMAEMPSLIALHRRFEAAGLTTLAVAMPYDRPDMVLNVARTRGLPFDVVLDFKGEVAGAFNDPQATPTKFLIDPSGQIVRTYVGFTDFDDLSRRIAAMLPG
jgi:peroxiredoxin